MSNGTPTQPGNLVRRLDSNGDITGGFGLLNYAVNSEAVAQNVYTRLRLFLAEWFLDTSAGVPYFQEILTKPGNLATAEGLIKTCILGTVGLATLDTFNMTFNSGTRKLTISGTATTIYGDTIDIMVRQ